MKLIAAISAWLDMVGAEMARWAAQTRTGVTLIEAVAADEFETKLRSITLDREERDALREATLKVAQIGLRLDEIVMAASAAPRKDRS
jgi:hypothetical protein